MSGKARDKKRYHITGARLIVEYNDYNEITNPEDNNLYYIRSGRFINDTITGMIKPSQRTFQLDIGSYTGTRTLKIDRTKTYYVTRK